jgi:uncharacterized membrane protein YdcZ (DUF606 family)
LGICVTAAIIDNFSVAGVSARPLKTQSVLDIDSDCVLAFAVARERFK